jgi:hypothetical protein
MYKYENGFLMVNFRFYCLSKELLIYGGKRRSDEVGLEFGEW